MSIRVLIADDQPIVRTGLTMLLDAQPDIDVVGAAADGREAVRLAPDACREHALRHNEPYGIWGGLTEEQRAHRA